jgi:hypothetical protein
LIPLIVPQIIFIFAAKTIATKILAGSCQLKNKLDARCWMLDTGCSMLDTGCSILDAGYWILDTGCWMLDTGYSIFHGARLKAKV